MRDYATISKRLRRYSENCVAYKLDADFANAVTDAADAIEELLHKLCDFCGCCLAVDPDPYHCEIIGTDLSCQETPKEVLPNGEV